VTSNIDKVKYARCSSTVNKAKDTKLDLSCSNCRFGVSQRINY